MTAVIAVSCASVKLPNDPIACTAIAVSALNVTVRDAANGAPVCDAAVTALQGDARFDLRQTGDCRYAGAEERDGVFEVRANRAGYGPAFVAGIRVGRDECHVIPVAVTVDLHPNG